MERKISVEEWADLSKKLRNRVSPHFTPEQLRAIDEFIRMGSHQFDQVGH
jgi:hypothetical protein